MRTETAVWLLMADEDWAAARVVLDADLRRSAVFHVHLAVEKTLKALIWEETGTRPPYWHGLIELAGLLSLEMPFQVRVVLENLRNGYEARYAESDRQYSRRVCDEMMTATNETLRWLKQTLI
jgi:HEPN domain-containing protein